MATNDRPRLSTVLPPLVFGTAAFNTQFNLDPFALGTTGLVSEALALGIRAFDTSPYYGPAETLLGDALEQASTREALPRQSYHLLTKVGRIAESEFDYSPAWVRESVERSLSRLRTEYLDVVYCHDVEFVSADEVLAAVGELRRLRDTTGTVRYVGLSGYPVGVLADLADRVLAATGEPVDIVQSYAHFTLQNTRLASEGIARLRAAGVSVVPNASPLGMGLLRASGVPVGAGGDFHPAPRGLRDAVAAASRFTDAHGERLEAVAIRYALEEWMRTGAEVGAEGDPATGVEWTEERRATAGWRRLGVSVIGVSTPEELAGTMMVWRSALDGFEGGQAMALSAGRWRNDHVWSRSRRSAVHILAEGIREILGEWVDYSWDSPPKGFVNSRRSGAQPEHD